MSDHVTFLSLSSFPGYRVGSDGSVWSLRRPGNGPEISDIWRKLKPVANSRGYMAITLCKDRRRFTKMVHRIVAEAFLGPCPEGQECCHNNGDSLDNRIENLRYDTHGENIIDRTKHGKTPRGENHKRAKLSESDVLSIRREYAGGGITLKSLALRHRVNLTLIHAIVKRKIWQHVTA